MNVKSFSRFWLSAFCFLLFSITASAQLNWSGTQTFNSNTTISQNINLTGNVTIVVNTDKDVIISGVISGPYSITKTGTGYLRLTNNNTYTGGTTISQGELWIGANTTAGSVTGNIVNNSKLYFHRSNDYTYSGIISGTGSVYHWSMQSTLTLSGANTYSGWTYNYCKLVLGASGSIENSSVRLYSAAELDISAGNKKIKALNSTITNTKVTLGLRTLTIDGGGTFAGVISGTGGIIKSGTGKLSLNGANTYTGTTNINADTLAIGANGTIANSYSVGFGYNYGSTAFLDVSAGNTTIKNLGSNFENTEVVLGGKNLTINTTVYSGFAGKITGTGSIIKTGTNVFILGGENTYTGTTYIQTGTLYIGNGATTGSVTSNISNFGTLTFHRSNNYTYAGVISGTGKVEKEGAATLFLTGANTYTGGTLVKEGTLSIGNNTTIGSITGNIEVAGSNTKLQFYRSNPCTYSDVISGTGSVIKDGTSNLFFTNNNTYTGGTTIKAGSLFLGNNTTNGSVVGNIVNNGSLRFYRTTNVTYSGVISGTGDVYQLSDNNSLTLSGANTYSGTTYIVGKLILGTNGSIENSSNISIDANNELDISAGNKKIKALNSSATTAKVVLGTRTLTIGTAGQSDGSGTFAGVISGTGSVIKTGSATLYFTNNNTYTGTTTISQGSLYLGYNTINGSVAGNIVNNGTLIFQRSIDCVYSGVISGTGSVWQNSQGNSLTLNGVNTYSGTTYINGKLILGASGSIENSSEVSLQNYTTAELDISAGNKKIKGLYSDSPTYANTKIVLGSRTLTIGTTGQNDGGGTYGGVISGTGSVIKNGTGTFTLSGQNTATGTFTHQSGTVNLSGKWSGAYDKKSGTTLTVTGNPTIGGSLTLAGGSINMNLTTTPPSKITVTGAVSASGTNTLNITTNAVTNYVLIAAASGIGSTTPYTVTSSLHTYLTATGTQLLLNASTTPMIPTITTTTLPDGLVGSSYSATLTATGLSPITWTVESGNLPNGLSLSTAGAISGTCSTQGTFNFTVKATNAAGSATKSLTIIVKTNATAPVITTTTLPDGVAGFPYSETLTATGTAPITWTIETGNLPAGLTISTGGVISGTPTTEGTFNFSVKAANSVGSDTKPLTIKIYTIPAITTTTLPDGTIGTAYNATLAATGTTPITWTIESGNLPAGLTISTGGAISGTPTTEGTFDFTVKATNNYGTDTKSLTITILTNEVAPVITTTTLPDGAIGTTYNATLTATGSTPITWSIENGNLPNGLILNADGVISGTPTAADTFTFTVKATNNVGSDNKTLTITIAAEATPPVITTTTLPNGAIGTAYNATLTATGTAPIIWTIETGNLPTGLTLNTDGIISGTPTAEGAFSFTVKATNSVGEDTKELEIVIGSVGIVETQGIASVRVFPNPTKGEIQIESGKLKIENVDIYDIMGKKIIFNFQLSTFNLTDFPSGIYFLKITTDSGVITKKVIKQ